MVLSPPSVTGIALRQSRLGEFYWNRVLLKYAVPLQSSRLAERDGSARVLFGKKNEGKGGEDGLSKHPNLIALKWRFWVLITFCFTTENAKSSY